LDNATADGTANGETMLIEPSELNEFRTLSFK
jgi:hypothetical protein